MPVWKQIIVARHQYQLDGFTHVLSTLAPQMPRMRKGLPEKEPIAGISKVVVVASGKGGVGKSTVAANLAVSMAQQGKKTGLLDADLFGPSIPRMMNLKTPVDGLEVTTERQLMPLTNYGIKCMSMGFLISEAAPIVWRGLMVMKAIEQLLRQVKWSLLDLLVIDLPPGTGDTQLSISQQIPINGAIIVTTPQDVAVADARKGVEMFRKVDVPIIGIVENMSSFTCSHCHSITAIHETGPGGQLDQLVQEMQVSIIANIPIEPEVSKGSDQGIPIVISHPFSSSASEFKKLTAQVISKLSL